MGLWIRTMEVSNMADLKACPCGKLPEQNHSEKNELLRDLLERRGLVEDPSIPNEKARAAEQELRRNMYHNIYLPPASFDTGAPVEDTSLTSTKFTLPDGLYYSDGSLGRLKIPSLGLSVKVYEDESL